MLRLDPPIWLHTPKGDALAHIVTIETGMDIAWVCCIANGPNAGQCWTLTNQHIRFMSNETIGLRVDNPWSNQ